MDPSLAVHRNRPYLVPQGVSWAPASAYQGPFSPSYGDVGVGMEGLILCVAD